MQFLFSFLALLGSCYFLFTRRRFDYFSLAYFSAIVYFMPGFFGNAATYIDGIWNEVPLQVETYWIMLFVLCSIPLTAITVSLFPGEKKINVVFPAESFSISLVLLFSVAGLIGVLLTAGSVVHDPDKTVVMESLGRWHILFYVSATLGLPYAYQLKRYWLAAIFLLLLLFDLYLGFRSSLAIGVISVVVLALSEAAPKRVIVSHWRMLLVLLAFGLFMFGYKMVAYVAKAGLWDTVWAYFQNEHVLSFMLMQSEPFLVQQTLNEIVRTRFETGFDHILSSFYQFIVLAPELGAENVKFNDLFQPVLFPEVGYGLAANIWAQMWSAGGWPLLAVFTLIFNLVLGLGNISLCARSAVLRAGLAPMFCYWAFYIHRNDLSFALALEKRQLLLLVLVSAIAAIAWHATRTVPSRVGLRPNFRG
jgi:hypothetical protein